MPTKPLLRVAVVGATGAVGSVLLPILEERGFPVARLVPFASERSRGKPVRFKGVDIPCEVLTPGCFKGVQIAFFDASDAISARWVPEAVAAGAWVVDNSSTYRMAEDVPLLVPEVNGDAIGRIAAGSPRVFAGPNCSTVQMVVALKPIQDRWGLKRVVVSTYQSVSGAGLAAQDELRAQTREALAGGSLVPSVFPHPIAWNCLPHIGGFGEDGTTSEERKMIAEAKRILGLPGLAISATAVRVPTLHCHAESINVECEREPGSLAVVREVLRAQPGLIVQDEPSRAVYPLGVEAAGKDGVYVGRIRKDLSVAHGLNLWVVSDNLRKGAALNAVQIGEMLLERAFS